MLVGDLARELQFIPETLDGIYFSRDLRLDKFERDVLFDLPVKHPIDPAHPSSTQLFDDLVFVGKDTTGAKPSAGCIQGLGEAALIFRYRGKRFRTLLAEFGIRKIIGLTLRAFHINPGLRLKGALAPFYSSSHIPVFILEKSPRRIVREM